MNTLVDQAKSSTADHTQGGNDGDFIAPAGMSMARFIGYVEVGVRNQKPWKGQIKKDCAEARFTFELLSPKNIREITLEDETKITVTDVIGSKVAMKTGDRSSFVKLLRKMTYGREGIINFAQMLGEPFLINVIHAPGKDRDGNDKIYANMKDKEFNWTIGAPIQVDAISGTTTQLPVPEPTMPLRLLLWDNPTKEQWNSVFIDGTRTVQAEDGSETEESKNWLQRDIVTAAINFAGSPLEQMLNGVSDLAIPGDMADEPTEDAKDAAENIAAEAVEVISESMAGTQAEQLAAAQAIIAQLTGK